MYPLEEGVVSPSLFTVTSPEIEKILQNSAHQGQATGCGRPWCSVAELFQLGGRDMVGVVENQAASPHLHGHVAFYWGFWAFFFFFKLNCLRVYWPCTRSTSPGPSLTSSLLLAPDVQIRLSSLPPSCLIPPSCSAPSEPLQACFICLLLLGQPWQSPTDWVGPTTEMYCPPVLEPGSPKSGCLRVGSFWEPWGQDPFQASFLGL